MAHLRRLDRISIDHPIFFVTTCTSHRRRVLANQLIVDILIDEWRASHERHGWAVGRYVVMPDHVHFFCCPELDSVSLSRFMQSWKEWTSKRALRAGLVKRPLWQSEFFDHLIRSMESYQDKREYVFNNPVKAGLATSPELWHWQGELVEF